MNIVSLKIKNFMSIQDAELKLGQINQIVGVNSQGKTTILKAIETAAKGSTDGSLVKFGEEEAEIIIELPDETTIKRKIKSEGKQSVEVKKGEFKAPKPQEFLESLFDFSAFNPIELLEPKKRSEAIMKSIELNVTPEAIAQKLGVDKETLPEVDYKKHGLEVIDQIYKYYYQRRAEANRTLTDKKNRLDTYKKDFKEMPAPAFTRQDLENEKNEINAAISARNEKIAAIKATHEANRKAGETVAKYQKAVDEIKAEIEKKKQELAQLEARYDQGLKAVEEAKKNFSDVLEGFDYVAEEVNALKLKLNDITARSSNLDAYEATERQRTMLNDLEGQVKEAEIFTEGLTNTVDALRGTVKEEFMATVEMPIKGLEYKDGVFYVDGTPIDNLSSSMALRLAVSVARKLAKKTKIVCIDGAELLDQATYDSFLKEIKDDGFTYFITKVGEGSNTENIIKMSKGQVVQ